MNCTTRRWPDRRSRSAVSRLLAPLLGTVLAAASACSSGGDTVARDDEVVAGSPAVPDDDTAEDVLDGEIFTEADGGSDAGGVDDLGPVPPPLPSDAVGGTVAEPIEPVPDTGVPGIESDDDFCRAWSEFAGSYQALTLSWAVVGGASSARLEVIANDALRSAVDTMSAALPDELAAERDALVVALPTPILRRADRSRDLLAAEGIDDAANERLAGLWISALTEAGIEADDLTVPIDDAALDAGVDAAAATFADELPPITEDPSLIVDVQIPLTEQYLFDTCPDKGILAGNDNVDL